MQDTLARKVNSSDASEYATMIGCCGSRFWGEPPQTVGKLETKLIQGAFWLLISLCCELSC